MSTTITYRILAEFEVEYETAVDPETNKDIPIDPLPSADLMRAVGATMRDVLSEGKLTRTLIKIGAASDIEFDKAVYAKIDADRL
jgi:hypothetical protein